MSPRIRDIGLIGEADFAGATLAQDTAWLWTALEEDNDDALDIVGGEKLIELPLDEAFERVGAEDVRLGRARLDVDGECVCTLAEFASANDCLDRDDLLAIAGLRVGDSFVGGGGAAASFTIQRVA